MKTLPKLLLGSIFLFISHFSIGQNSKIDSLKSVWEDTQLSDSLRLEASSELFITYIRQNPDTARAFGHKMLQFAQERGNKKWEAISIRYLGNTFAYRDDTQKPCPITKKA